MLQSSEIYIRNLRFHAYHGVLPQESVLGNDFVVNVRLHCSIEKAMQSDNLHDTINYATVFEIIRQQMAIPSKLLEHVAGRIGQQLFNAFPEVEAIDLDITKLNPPMGADCDGAGVALHLINNKTK